MISKFRDVSIIDLGDKLLTVACDSCGGVGMLEGDTIKADGFNLGYRTAFVAVAETLAIGAEPLMITDTLSVSLGEYGKSIIKGVKAAALEAGLKSEAVTGSSEENFIPTSTGIGITVIGTLPKGDYKPMPTEDSYEAILVGTPLSGNDILDKSDQILSLPVIRQLAQNPDVLDILPAGSRGVLFEANEMANTLGMSFRESVSDPSLIRISAGPASCAVIAAATGTELSEIEIPITKIGEFVR